MVIFVLKSTWAYLYLFAILGLGYARNVPRDDETMDETPVDLLGQIPPSSKLNPCSVPEQPTNGGWKLDPQFCDDGLDCDVFPGSFVDEGSHLIYTCDSGYRVEGDPDVYCTPEGEWTPIPSCIRLMEADTKASSSMTTMTGGSSDPTREETFKLSESENNYPKMNNSETSRRSKKIGTVVKTVAKVGCHLILGFLLGSMGDPICQIGAAAIAKE